MKKINNAVVRIIAEDIDINWRLPYLLEEPMKGQGTGFFIDNKGHILTCAHVVNGAKNIIIEIPNIGSDKYECDIIGICPQFDIALLKTKKYMSKDYLLLGDSSTLKVGTTVQVIGYPVSHSSKQKSNSVNNLKYTVGILSGQQSGLIQTDSAINPGNSGGPLFCNGKVIGINSQKLTGDSLENIGYAVPINNYKIIMDDFKSGNKIIYRPDLLFEYNNSDEKILNILTGGKINSGIVITKIYDISPLKKTTIKENSIITEIDNIKIDNYGLTNIKWLGTFISINTLLDRIKNNTKIKIKHFTDNKLEETTVKLEPFIPAVRVMYPVFEHIPYFIIGGMIFMDFCYNHINIASKHKYNLLCIVLKKEESTKPRLLLSFIFPNSKVSILQNLKNDDIITKINDKSVCCINDLKKAIKKPIIINNKEYIKVETEDYKSVILSMEDVIEQNRGFSNIYRIPKLNNVE